MLNILALLLFKKVKLLKKQQKQSLSTTYQVNKIVLIILISAQPLFNSSLISLVYILMVPVVFAFFFLKPSIGTYRGINYVIGMSVILQNIVTSPFFTFNMKGSEFYFVMLNLLNQLFIILILDKEITSESLSLIF